MRAVAVKFDDRGLNDWAESVAINLHMELTRYCSDGEPAHLHEALVLADSLPAIIEEQVARSMKRF